MKRIAFVIAAAVAAGCAPAPVTIVASPSPSVRETVTPTASSSATADPGPLNVARAVGTIPRSFHYFDTGQGESYRILLFDEEKTEPPVVVLTSGRPPAPPGPDVRSEAFTVSADGRVLVLMRRLSEQETTYYAIRPETGEIRALLHGPDLGPPVIAPDGQRVAYARTSTDPAINGVWVATIGGGTPTPTRLVNDMPQRVGSPPQPVAWSADGTWLAIAVGQSDSGAEIAVVDPSAGETRFSATTNEFVGGRARVLGPGYAVDWRGGEAAVLVTSTRTLFGGQTEIYTVDVATGARRSLYRPSGDVVLGAATFDPALDRYATTEHPIVGGLTAPTAVWVRRLDGSATKVAESPFLSPPWWSRDGTKLFSITGGDDSNGSIKDLLGTGSTPFCVRGGTPPRCT